MLELKKINKTYHSKKGVAVHALKDISLTFGETGLVFVLGKSGCGKSTLLNVLGGLDKFESGEIVIKGKSSLGFSQSDFDSYRNTCIGFVFQEYNMLNEFDVRKNISLALELQGCTASDEKIKETLDVVGLSAESGRKIDELSGGQKQRVAIARAIIKEPEIILADEPTGALDEETGNQIFQLLKDLSKTKLVVVVSHDRDFAEKFADRIIEMKDGRIISDSSRDMLGSTPSTDKKSDAPQEEFKLKKSALKWVECLKIGASAVKTKPIRLVMSLLLSMCAFSMCGLVDTIVAFDAAAASTNTIYDKTQGTMSVNKAYKSGFYSSNQDMHEHDVDNISATYNFQTKPVLNLNVSYSFSNQLTSSINYSIGSYYRSSFNGAVNFNESEISQWGFDLIGQLPQNDGEIAVSSYIYSHFKQGGLVQIGGTSKNDEVILAQTYTPEQLAEPENLLGKFLYLKNESYKITGVVDTKLDASGFEELLKYGNREIQTLLEEAMMKRGDWESLSYYNLHSALFVSEDYFSSLIPSTRSFASNVPSLLYACSSPLSSVDLISNITNFNSLTAEDYVLFNGETLTDGKLGDNELLLDFRIICEAIFKHTIPNLEIPEAYQNLNFAEAQKMFDDEQFISWIKDNPLIADFIKLNERQMGDDVIVASNAKIVGFFNLVQSDGYSYIQNSIVGNDDFFFNNSDGIFSYTVIKTNSKSDLKNFFSTNLQIRFDEENQPYFTSPDSSVSAIAQFGESNRGIGIFHYAAIALTIFATLLLGNFISSTISNKKHEIGILRALGARKKDVFLIFFFESMVVALLNFLLSCIGTYIAVVVSTFYVTYPLILLSFSIRQVAILFALCCFIGCLAAAIPIANITSKQPIDAIKKI